MKRKKFFETRREANSFLKKYLKVGDYWTAGGNKKDFNIYDLKKNFPKRKKTRFFVGTYFEWLNI